MYKAEVDFRSRQKVGISSYHVYSLRFLMLSTMYHASYNTNKIKAKLKICCNIDTHYFVRDCMVISMEECKIEKKKLFR